MSSIVWIVATVFALALVGGALRKFRKDACLAFLDRTHATLLGRDGRAMWGDMLLTSQGLELCFDAPHVDERGLAQSAAIIFPPAISEMIALVRSVHGMTPDERRRREAQVRAVLHPGPGTRLKRSLANLGGILRDAVVDTIGILLGQLGAASKRKPVAALAERQKQVTEVGGAVLDLGARAFEPLLERHIGKPVIVEIEIPGERPRRVEMPGYLADYNERYLVIVNDSHEPEESTSIAPGEARDGACASMTLTGDRVEIACTCGDAIVVRRLVGRSAAFDVGATLFPGTRLSMHLPADFGVERADIDRTRRVDFVSPRARSQARFASTRPPIRRDPWIGIGPG